MTQKINNQPENLTIQVNGQAVFNTDAAGQQYVQFLPDIPTGGLCKGWRREGVAQLLGNGTYDFISRRRIRASSTLLKKVAHGRLSATKDGAYQLTLKIFKTEGLPIAETLRREAAEATDLPGIGWRPLGTEY